MKIHILGASGSGTSTIGKIISQQLNIPFFECDDFFWKKTKIPFSEKRPLNERKKLLNKMFKENNSWLLSGSALKWGDRLLKEADYLILLYCEKEERIKRLKKREKERFGSRIDVGNDMHENHKNFIEWAMKYDQGGLDMRSKKSEEQWLKKAKGKVIKISNYNIDTTVKEIIRQLEKYNNKFYKIIE